MIIIFGNTALNPPFLEVLFKLLVIRAVSFPRPVQLKKLCFQCSKKRSTNMARYQMADKFGKAVSAFKDLRSKQHTCTYNF